MLDKKNILICDDEEGVRESLNLILGADYNLAFAANGGEALNYLKKHNVDLVIMDIKMPQKNGLETLREIHKDRPNLKVIMVTGYQSIETAREATKHGVFEYITKPFESATVKSAVKKAFNQ